MEISKDKEVTKLIDGVYINEKIIKSIDDVSINVVLENGSKAQIIFRPQDKGCHAYVNRDVYRMFIELERFYLSDIVLKTGCEYCKYKDLNMDEEPCDSCCGEHSYFEPIEVEQ